jgi:hypothetical protein
MYFILYHQIKFVKIFLKKNSKVRGHLKLYWQLPNKFPPGPDSSPILGPDVIRARVSWFYTTFHTKRGQQMPNKFPQGRL